MTDARIRKLARLMTEYSAPVTPGQQAVITGTSLAEPLIAELGRAVLERGAYPVIRMMPARFREFYNRYASDEVLSTVPSITRRMYEEMDAYYYVLSEENTRALTGIPPERAVMRERARQQLSAMIMERAAAGEVCWTLTLYPTPAYAQDAEMGLLEFSEFLYDAIFLNEDDPAACWQRLAERQGALIDYLTQAREVHLRAPGTDLHIGTGGRRWVNDCGDHNLPAGEIFTGPIETEVNGHITFNFPAIRFGREVRGIRLRFEEGRVVEATAERNEAYLRKVLDIDEGARIVGEFAFGTNYNISRFSRNTLFDEKIGGTVHLALGKSYPETGGQNNSAIHWDLVRDLREESEVYVDGELFQKNGRFTILDDGIV